VLLLASRGTRPCGDKVPKIHRVGGGVPGLPLPSVGSHVERLDISPGKCRRPCIIYKTGEEDWATLRARSS
jgi:hypothetical protein